MNEPTYQVTLTQAQYEALQRMAEQPTQEQPPPPQPEKPQPQGGMDGFTAFLLFIVALLAAWGVMS